MSDSNSLESRDFGPDDIVRRALVRGVLTSDRRRVVVLAVMLVFLLGLLWFVLHVPGLIEQALLDRMREGSGRMMAVLLGMTAYECAVWFWLGRLLTEGRRAPSAFDYLNAAIEAGIGTVVLLLVGGPVGNVQALAGSLPYVYFPFIVLTALHLDFRLCVFSGAVAAAGFLGASMFLLRGQEPVPGFAIFTAPLQYAIKGIFLLLTGVVSGYVAGQLRGQLGHSLRAARERDRAVSIFGQHVSPQVADRLLHQPIELSGEERVVCVLFLDIRDFSRLSGECTATETMAYLNALFCPMITAVNRHHGIVNKFLGDGFMAVFGAPVDDPESCRNAVRCALELLRQADELNASGSIPSTRVGIGLHLGPAVTGNVGSEQRMEYTIIGDTVNLAARIEQATKQFSAQLLVSETVWRMLGESDVRGEDLGLVELKGQARPVRLFKLA